MRFKKLKKVLESVEISDFVSRYYNELISEIDTAMRNKLTLSENLNVDIKTVSIGNGKTATITHSLKSVPKYRIILRQSGNATITDGTTWNDRSISLVNNGPNNVTITVGIFKE